MLRIKTHKSTERGWGEDKKQRTIKNHGHWFSEMWIIDLVKRELKLPWNIEYRSNLYSFFPHCSVYFSFVLILWQRSHFFYFECCISLSRSSSTHHFGVNPNKSHYKLPRQFIIYETLERTTEKCSWQCMATKVFFKKTDFFHVSRSKADRARRL